MVRTRVVRWSEAVFRSRLFLRLFSLLTLVVALFSSAIYFFSVPLIKEAAYEIELNASRTILDNVFELASKIHVNLEAHRAVALNWHKSQLRNVIEVAESYINFVLSREARGELSREEARRLIFDGLRTFKYGSNGYLWVIDHNSMLLSHPDPELQGQDALTLRAEEGQVLATIVSIARDYGDGTHTYTWRRPGKQADSAKLSYFKDFPELGVVVGTGVYLDEVEEEVARRKEAAVRDLRQALRNISIAKTGYVYIFDASNRMIIHPNTNIEQTDFADLKNPATGRPINEELKESTGKGVPVSYLWDKPSDPGNYAYEKISWVRHFDGFDWYIASSVYVEELRRSSEVLANRILAIALAVMVLATSLGYMAARWLVDPINRLAETAARVRGGDLEAQSGVDRDDEIGSLAATFDAMIRRLRDNIATLDSRVRVRTAALEASNRRLMEAQRLTAVGQLSGGLAHDFNNLLSVILGNISAARDRFADVEGLDGYLEPAARAGRRGADITSRLLAFARRQSLRPAPVDVCALLRETAVLLRRTFPASIEVAVPPDEQRGWCFVDPNQLENALVNLALNARDAMPRGGTLRIEVAPAWVHEATAYDEAVAPGDYVEVRVADTGCGFAPEALGRAFEPFYTTKELGSGLGLSMVYGFVKQSGGYIRLESQPGKGSCVRLLLPACEEPAAVIALTTGAAVAGLEMRPGDLALLVEDDEDVRQVVRGQLMDLGYSVLEAASADEAEELVGMVEGIALVVSDVVMPGTRNGIDLVQRVRQAHPHIRIVLMSGFAMEGVERPAEAADLAILRKPFDKQDLIEAIRRSAHNRASAALPGGTGS